MVDWTVQLINNYQKIKKTFVNTMISFTLESAPSSHE